MANKYEFQGNKRDFISQRTSGPLIFVTSTSQEAMTYMSIEIWEEQASSYNINMQTHVKLFLAFFL